MALDVHDVEEDAKLGLPPGTVWVHQLFISSALQGGGYGVATMAQVESIAAQEPMNAKWMALDTLAKEVQKEAGDQASIDVAMKNIVPVVSKMTWSVQNDIHCSRSADVQRRMVCSSGIRDI